MRESTREAPRPAGTSVVPPGALLAVAVSPTSAVRSQCYLWEVSLSSCVSNCTNKSKRQQRTESLGSGARTPGMKSGPLVEKDWLFYYEWHHHPGEHEANAQKRKLPDPGFWAGC